MSINADPPIENNYYAICNLTSSSHVELPINSGDYESIRKSREALNEIASLEEKLFIILENYKRLELFVLESTLDQMIYYRGNWSEYRYLGADFAKYLLSLLSSARLYIDTIGRHAASITGDARSKDLVKIETSKIYDNNFGYRVLEALRNHSQHYALPVHSSSHGGNWNQEGHQLIFSTEFYFDYNKSYNDEKFKEPVREEMKRRGGKTELKSCTRQYISGICEIHMFARNLIKGHRSHAENCLEKWRSIWKENFSEGDLFLAACELREGSISDRTKTIYLTEKMDEYLNDLSSRTFSLHNMHCRVLKY